MPGTVTSENPKLKAVSDVDIDNGKFKYILCKVFDVEKPSDSKFIVRGTSYAEFHCKFFGFFIFNTARPMYCYIKGIAQIIILRF